MISISASTRRPSRSNRMRWRSPLPVSLGAGVTERQPGSHSGMRAGSVMSANTRSIGAPTDRVFALITDPARMPEWLPGCRSVTPAPKLTGKGDRHRILFERDGRRVDAEIEIIDYNPPYTYGWVEIRRRKGARTYFALQFQGGATKVTMKHIWEPVGLRAWLLGQFYRRRNSYQTFDSLLQNLRKVLTR